MCLQIGYQFMERALLDQEKAPEGWFMRSQFFLPIRSHVLHFRNDEEQSERTLEPDGFVSTAASLSK